jgi:membrane-associated phospholipid phosphatase
MQLLDSLSLLPVSLYTSLRITLPTSQGLKSGLSKRLLLCLSLLLLLSAPCVSAATPNTEPPTSPTLLHQDLQAMLQVRTLSLLGLSLGSAYLAHYWDDQLQGEVSNAQPFKTLFKVGNYYGSTTYGLLATGSLWTLSRLVGIDNLRPVASETLRAVVLANVVVSPFKFGVARRRPDGSNGLSFPSGHSANSFALTTVLARRYGRRLGIPLYGFATMVPLARINGDKHFFSDVCGGALIGIIAGWSVTQSGQEDQRVELTPAGGVGYWGFNARRHF